MRTRTDTHRPAEMVPGEYEYLACSVGVETDDGMEAEWEGEEKWDALGSPMQSTCAHARRFQCDHCGAVHKYQVILLHIPTGDIVSVGHECYANRFSRHDWKNVVADKARRLELAAKYRANTAKAIAEMSDECRAAYEWALTDTSDNIAHDIAGKVEKFGPLSEKQAAFLVKLHAQWIEKQRQLAEGEVAPCPEGKQTITGTVVSVKFVENDFGGTMKMTVRDDRGFRVYGTLPAAIEAIQPGERCQFNATLEPSQKDPTFGFFSRPTKARVPETTECTCGAP